MEVAFNCTPEASEGLLSFGETMHGLSGLQNITRRGRQWTWPALEAVDPPGTALNTLAQIAKAQVDCKKLLKDRSEWGKGQPTGKCGVASISDTQCSRTPNFKLHPNGG